MIKIIYLITLSIFAMLASPQIFACNVRTLPYEWPLFANTESSQELKIEAKKFLAFLLTEIKNGRKDLLDTWSHPQIREGIKNALGLRAYKAALTKASNDGNDFALVELLHLDLNFITESNCARLASSQIPYLLFDGSGTLPHFWSTFNSTYGFLKGATPKEKLINAAIDNGWSLAGAIKAEELCGRYLRDSNPAYLEEAFRLFRHTAHKGFENIMYRLFVRLREFPEYALSNDEAQMWLEKAADLDNCDALYASATFYFDDDNFPAIKERLNRLATLPQCDFTQKRDAAYLMDLALLRERGLELSVIENKKFKWNHNGSGSSTLITPCMYKMTNKLQEMLAEIDKMNNELNTEPEVEEDDSFLCPTESSSIENSSEELPEPAEQFQVKVIPEVSSKLEEKIPHSSKAKIGKKKKKVAERKDNRKNKLSKNITSNNNQNVVHEISFADNPFAAALKIRLHPVRDLVKALLEGEHLNGRGLQTFFNAFQSINVENVVGSHNKVNIEYVEGLPKEKITIVSPHKGKRRDLTGKYKTMSGKLRSLLHGLGIRKIEDIE